MDAAFGDLAFLSLGGVGEIGMNFNVYRCDGALLAVDCGIGFARDDTPEVEILVPDPTWLAQRREQLVGLIITHAHEDHLGAVPHLWRDMRCPIHATPFAAAVLRRKLAEAGLEREVPLIVTRPRARFRRGPFDLEFLPVTHSVPEAQALVIRTRYGVVLHTGDWKLDPDPLIGPPTDQAAFAALGEEGVLAMVCDSTNALIEGHSGSEAEVRRNLAAIIRSLRGRVAVTGFASNVARLESIALAGQAAGRRVALVGRALWNIEAAARECGYLTSLPPFVPEEEAASFPDDEILLICTGSQGEPRSALARIAADNHPHIALGEGDTVIFSSRRIPGNERAIQRIQDELVRRGCRVMTDEDHMVHVSGHPARDELRRLYGLVRPRFAIPVHGEWRHLREHAALAAACGAEPIVIADGDVLRLSGPHPEICDAAPTGRLAVDGERLLPMEGQILQERRRMMHNGFIVASLAVDKQGRLLGEPQISAPGLFDLGDPEPHLLVTELVRDIAELPLALRREDAPLREAVRARLRREMIRRLRKRPHIEVHLLRV